MKILGISDIDKVLEMQFDELTFGIEIPMLNEERIVDEIEEEKKEFISIVEEPKKKKEGIKDKQYEEKVKGKEEFIDASAAEDFKRSLEGVNIDMIEVDTIDKSAVAKMGKSVEEKKDQEQVEETDKKPDKVDKKEEKVDSGKPKTETVLGKSINDVDVLLTLSRSETQYNNSYLAKLLGAIGTQQSKMSNEQTIQTQSNDGKDGNQLKSTSTPGEKDISVEQEEK